MTREPGGKKSRPHQGRRERPSHPTEIGASTLTAHAELARSEDLRARIAERAYALYVDRGYRHGCAGEDWLDAEREILSQQRTI